MVCEIIEPCLIEGCKYQEKGVKISVKREKNETIKFYLIDNKKNPDCQLQKNFGNDKKICDLLIKYKKKNDRNMIFCLVELEGGGFKEAVLQIISTYTNFNSCKCCSDIEWKAFICFNLGSPIRVEDKYLKLMCETFSSENFFYTKQKGNNNLGNFLRRIKK
jgi:hypothetical protein